VRIALASDGPPEVIGQDVTGVLNTDRAAAIASALRLERRVCRSRAAAFSWDAATAQFLAGLAGIPLPLRTRLAASRSSAMIAPSAARRPDARSRRR
jgi:hypothetical protein